MKTRALSRTPLNVTAAMFAVAALAALFGGCNAVLGIEERELVAETEDGITCASYCDDVLEKCTDAFAQYQSREVCMATCALLPLGTYDDTQGNTVGCRLHNADLAASTGERADHCPIAGPGGGGACGDRCQNFCMVFTAVCSASAISDADACLNFCNDSRDNPEWTPLDDVLRDHDDSIQCRLWHLGNAAEAPDVHCGHADGTTKCELPAGGGTGGSGTGGGGAGGGG